MTDMTAVLDDTQQRQLNLFCEQLGIDPELCNTLHRKIFSFVCSQPYEDRKDIAKLIRVFETVFNIVHAHYRAETRQAHMNATQGQLDEQRFFVSNSTAMLNSILTDIDFASAQNSNKKTTKQPLSNRNNYQHCLRESAILRK